MWKETNGEEESMRWRWEEMAVRISILGWDSISIGEIIDNPFFAASLGKLCCQSVFSQGG